MKDDKLQFSDVNRVEYRESSMYRVRQERKALRHAVNQLKRALICRCMSIDVTIQRAIAFVRNFV